MQDMAKVKKIIEERGLKDRAFLVANAFDYDFAYCVEADGFCGVDIAYSEYVNNHYICFTKQPDGSLIYGVAFQGRTPLLRKPSTSEKMYR